MLSEFEADVANDAVYPSAAVEPARQSDYIEAQRRALASGDPGTLASELYDAAMFKSHNARNARIEPVSQSRLIGGSQFGVYYARVVCTRAIDEGREVEIYRARESRDERPASNAKIGTRLNPVQLLDDLRSNSTTPFRFAVLPEVGSGLSVRLA